MSRLADAGGAADLLASPHHPSIATRKKAKKSPNTGHSRTNEIARFTWMSRQPPLCRQAKS
jgi:hypothetical protein